MGARQYAYNTLTQDTDVMAVFANRVYQGQSLMSAQLVKPYLVIKMMNDPDDLFADDPDVDRRPHRQFFMVYVHDQRPSYVKLDQYCELVKRAFRLNPSSSEDRITWTTYLETSADFDDVTLDTVFRYVRFQAVMT